jgi:hypothetical protein
MLWTASGGTRPFDAEVLADRSHYLTMRGGDVYRNAVARMTESREAGARGRRPEVDDVDLLVGHQANVRILDAVASRLGVPAERCQVTVDQHGNTSAASIPLALPTPATRAASSRRHVLLTAFGAGLTWGACLLTWKEAAMTRVAIVSGGSGGIGAATCRALAADGPPRAGRLRRQRRGRRGGRRLARRPVRPCHLDVTDEDSVAAASRAAELGTLAVVVNNAGVADDDLLLRLDPARFDRTIEVNLRGAYLLSQGGVRPMLRARHGRIISVASVVGLHGNVGQTAYAASKAGLIGFTRRWPVRWRARASRPTSSPRVRRHRHDRAAPR